MYCLVSQISPEFMPARKKAPKIFVLDTSVILYDHSCAFNFQENDIAIPITVLEELDRFKKGNDIINYNAREFIRFLDQVSDQGTLHDWTSLKGRGEATGKLCVVMNEDSQSDARKIFGADKADHRILNVALQLAGRYPKRQVALVSKDINLRIKAKALDIHSADYETGKIVNVDSLFSGKGLVDGVGSALISQLYKEETCQVEQVLAEKPLPNQFFVLKNTHSSALAWFNASTGLLERIEKRIAYGITPRNAEQVFALHALLNPAIKLVTLQGVAGTGKTLLALAAAIEQREEYHQIYLARPVVPLSNKDLGYLPGDIKSKVNPYMEPLYDNLKYIKTQFKEASEEYQRIDNMLENEKLMIAPLAYIRGRSLTNVFFIVDEAQNLTPHEVKTIITRAGENTKIVFTGDIFQIDTPYLDTRSNGLSSLIDRLHGHPLISCVKLEKGERSELANLANDLL